MRTLLIPIIILFSALIQPFALSDEGAQRKTIATVNGKTITQEDVLRRLANFKDADALTLISIKQEIIDHLVTDILLDEFVDKQGLIVTQREIEDELNRMTKDFAGNQINTTQSLENVLALIGSNINEIKSSVKHSIALNKYFKDKLDNKALERVFEENKGLFNGESVRISHILINTRGMKTKEEFSKALEQIRDIKKEINRGLSFDEAVTKYSNCPSAQYGGDLGFIQKKGNFAKTFLDTAFSLKVGQISEPVQTEYGYHIIKVTDKKEGLDIKFEDVKNKVYTEALDVEIIKLLDRLKKEANITINE